MFSRALKELVSQTRTWLCIGSRPGISTRSHFLLRRLAGHV